MATLNMGLGRRRLLNFLGSRAGRLGIEFILLAASTAAFQASRLATGLISASVLSPGDYGLWGLFLAALSYSVYANMGLLSGANRDIPIRLGRSDVRAADEVERAAYGGTLVVAAAIGAILLLAAPFMGGTLALIAAVGAAAMSLQQLYLFSQMALRARLRFNAASVQQLLLAALFPIVALPLLSSLGVFALLSGQATAYLAGICLVLVAWRRDLRPSFDRIAWGRLVRTGFPIMIGGLVFAILTTADRWLVLALLGAASLGEYTLASLLSSGMLLASMVVAQQFYPRMAMRFGRSGSAGLLRMAFLQGGAVLLLLVPVGLSLAVAGPWAITTWLPAYAPAIPALLMLMLGYGVLLAGTGFWNLLIVVGRADIYVGAQLFAIVAEAALSLLFVSFGFGIFGVAAAATTAFLLLTVVGATAAARVTL